jgi:hypothetical protein
MTRKESKYVGDNKISSWKVYANILLVRQFTGKLIPMNEQKYDRSL